MLQQTYIDRLITTALDEDIHYIDVTTDNLLERKPRKQLVKY